MEMKMQKWILALFFLANLAQGEEYFGLLVGDLQKTTHAVQGKVYIHDENTIRINSFSYDGLGPGGVVYVGFVGEPNIESTPNSHGRTLPDPEGETTKIRKYDNENIMIQMPSDKTVRDLLWLSIWCVPVGVDFGSIQFSESIRQNPPAQVKLGQFTQRAHGVSSGDVILLNSRTIKINNLNYDGLGPAAWFVVGSTPDDFKYVDDQTTPKVPDEAGSLEKLKRYADKTITITLPEGFDVRGKNLRWLNIYCITAKQNFGEVVIPENVNVIPYSTSMVSASLPNCEEMNDKFQVAWQITGDNIQFEFMGKIDDDEYMAFGLSGSTSGSSMDNADVVVAHYSQDQAKADDYFLNQRAQCNAQGVGACPDSRVSGASPSTSDISGTRMNGITRVKFTRKLDTGDATGDKVYSASGDQYIVWATGKVNSDLIATKHSVVLTQSKQINFGRTAENKCKALQGTPAGVEPPPVVPWRECHICSEEEIRVTIGPTGGEKGYNAITKNNGWGIAIYLNGYLIPELFVERGKNYTFKIQAGDDTNNLAQYHPFYITDDPRGGYKQRTTEERKTIKIFAGLDTNGNPLPESVGPLCEYQQPVTIDASTYSSFPAYKQVLTLQPDNCDTLTSTTELTWTVPNDAPNLLYYQCFEHNWLGWKINVRDRDQITGCTPCSGSSFAFPSVLTMILAICIKTVIF